MGAVLLGGAFEGLVFGLLALGLVLTYRVSRIINFAYGETGMLACFVYLEVRQGSAHPSYFTANLDRGLWLSLTAGIGLGALLGAVTEVCVARPARRSSPLSGMVATIGMGTAFLFFAANRYGAAGHLSIPVVAGNGLRLFGLQLSAEQILIAVLAAVIVPTLLVLYRFTSLGLRLKACAIDPYAASLCGISVNATSTLTWTMAGALSALSAILIAGLSPEIDVIFMTLLTVRAFIAALAAGLTNLALAFGAGVALGVGQELIKYKIRGPGWTELILLVLILAASVFRRGGVVRTS